MVCQLPALTSGGHGSCGRLRLACSGRAHVAYSPSCGKLLFRPQLALSISVKSAVCSCAAHSVTGTSAVKLAGRVWPLQRGLPATGRQSLPAAYTVRVLLLPVLPPTLLRARRSSARLSWTRLMSSSFVLCWSCPAAIILVFLSPQAAYRRSLACARPTASNSAESTARSDARRRCTRPLSGGWRVAADS